MLRIHEKRALLAKTAEDPPDHSLLFRGIGHIPHVFFLRELYREYMGFR